MEAIRKMKVKRIGKHVTIELPDDFTADELDIIILPSKEEIDVINNFEIKAWRKSLKKDFSRFKTDLSKIKYTRDELYDRP